MAFLLRSRPSRPEWTVEESATYAALRDFKLLQLLSTDKKALRVARQLNLPSSLQQTPTPKTQVDGAGKASNHVSTRAQAHTDPVESTKRRQRLSQKKRKLRQASASKLQALVVGFLTRRKELPAAREIAFRRSRAEAATRAAALRENTIDAATRSLVATRMDVVSQGTSRPKRAVEVASSTRRIRPSSPLASSASSYASCEDEHLMPYRSESPQPYSWEDGAVHFG